MRKGKKKKKHAGPDGLMSPLDRPEVVPCQTRSPGGDDFATKNRKNEMIINQFPCF